MTALLLVHGRSQEMTPGARPVTRGRRGLRRGHTPDLEAAPGPRTVNPTYPHSIADHLSDPDVAGPIGDVLAHA